MMKIVINPSWKCQLNCDYCWLPHTKINKKAKEHTWGEWATAIKENVPRGSIVDFSGGDPLLYPGMAALCEEIGKHGINWAITTNALATKGVKELTAKKLPGAIVINISDHSGNKKAANNIAKLKEVYQVSVHRCEHPGAGENIPQAKEITYQGWAEGEALDGVKRFCNAGANHLVIDPAGDVFRCCVDMQLGHEPLGNIFPDGKAVPYEAQLSFVCDFGCSSCYTENPGEWMIEMKAVK